MVKKNYLGGLKLLLLPLFIMLLGMFSTAYAEPNNMTPSNMMTPEIAKEIVDYLCDNSVYSSINSGTQAQNIVNSYRQLADYEQFCEAWNNSGVENYCDVLEQCIFIPVVNSNGQPRLTVYFVNNSIGNTLPYFLIESNINYTYRRYIFYRDDNGNKISGYRFWIAFYDTGTIAFGNDNELPATGNTITATGSNWWNVTDNILYYKMLFTYHFQGWIYYQNAWYRNREDTVLDYVNVFPEPDEPDVPVDTGNTGTITNPSGETTGNIDLSGIQAGIAGVQNQISGDTQRIIDNQNQNTEAIVNALTDSETEQDTESIEEKFEDMLSSTENIVDPTTNFFSWLIDNIRSVLNSTGNYNISITLFNETYTISSDFFTLPDGELKTFLQMSFIAWFGWRIIKKIRYIVYAIQCVNISSALNSVDFNPDIL